MFEKGELVQINLVQEGHDYCDEALGLNGRTSRIRRIVPLEDYEKDDLNDGSEYKYYVEGIHFQWYEFELKAAIKEKCKLCDEFNICNKTYCKKEVKE